MLKRLKKPAHQSLAEKAAREVSPENGVGKFLGTSDEGSHLTNYRFESKLKGYLGWEWSVIIFQSKKSAPATVSEVLLLPGKESIIAPEWVPWSDRRAELEKTQAQESASSDLEEPVDSKSDSKKTTKRPPIRKRVIKALIKAKKQN
jgi:hypothetical protein